MTSWHIMSFLLKFLFQLSKPIAVITVPLIFTKCINTYWNTKLQLDCQSKSSLSLLSTTSLEMGKTHIVWDSINNSVWYISLIETFSLIVIWWSRLSCLLCSSADIGNVPNNRYTAEFAVLIGRDCTQRLLEYKVTTGLPE
jgi:hypothetical protein